MISAVRARVSAKSCRLWGGGLGEAGKMSARSETAVGLIENEEPE
jgi:hypothetical protein